MSNLMFSCLGFNSCMRSIDHDVVFKIVFVLAARLFKVVHAPSSFWIISMSAHSEYVSVVEMTGSNPRRLGLEATMLTFVPLPSFRRHLRCRLVRRDWNAFGRSDRGQPSREVGQRNSWVPIFLSIQVAHLILNQTQSFVLSPLTRTVL